MRRLWPFIGVAVLTVVVVRGFFWPAPPPPPIPRIVTVYDTIYDTLRIVAPRRTTTDTVQLVTRQTVYDTVYLNLGCDPAQRSAVWPILSVEAGKKVGDTTVVSSFSLRTGEGAVSRIWTPGPLLGVWSDTTATPRITFGPPPAPRRTPFLTKLTWAGVGYASCSVVNGIGGILSP